MGERFSRQILRRQAFRMGRKYALLTIYPMEGEERRCTHTNSIEGSETAAPEAGAGSLMALTGGLPSKTIRVACISRKETLFGNSAQREKKRM